MKFDREESNFWVLDPSENFCVEEAEPVDSGADPDGPAPRLAYECAGLLIDPFTGDFL